MVTLSGEVGGPSALEELRSMGEKLRELDQGCWKEANDHKQARRERLDAGSIEMPQYPDIETNLRIWREKVVEFLAALFMSSLPAEEVMWHQQDWNSRHQSLCRAVNERRVTSQTLGDFSDIVMVAARIARERRQREQEVQWRLASRDPDWPGERRNVHFSESHLAALAFDPDSVRNIRRLREALAVAG